MSIELRRALSACLEEIKADPATQALFLQALEAATKEKLMRMPPLKVTLQGTIDVLRDINGVVSGVVSDPIVHSSSLSSPLNLPGAQVAFELQTRTKAK